MGTRTLKIEYPEDIPASMGEPPEEFENELKLLMAAKLYELGRVSSARAAQIAGMKRVQFLESLSEFGVSVFNYPNDELHREIQEARERQECGWARTFMKRSCER